MKILIVGSGGREHTLAWKVSQSPPIDKIYAAPGNGGMADIAECVDIKDTDIKGLREFAQKEGIDLTVVGPEAPLMAGMPTSSKGTGQVLVPGQSGPVEGSGIPRSL